MNGKRVIKVGVLILVCISLVSCATSASREQKGAGYGAATGAGIGAILGQAIGGDTEGTLIGAGAGAIVGGLAGWQIGKYMDRQEQELRTAMAQQERTSIQRDQDVLKATFESEVFFDFDSATIKPGGVQELQRVADVLKKYRKTYIVVAGHTDKIGSEAYNQELSVRRAESVKRELMNQGVISERLEAVGFGETKPISSDPAQNRRVEIYIKPIRQG